MCSVLTHAIGVTKSLLQVATHNRSGLAAGSELLLDYGSYDLSLKPLLTSAGMLTMNHFAKPAAGRPSKRAKTTDSTDSKKLENPDAEQATEAEAVQKTVAQGKSKSNQVALDKFQAALAQFGEPAAGSKAAPAVEQQAEETPAEILAEEPPCKKIRTEEVAEHTADGLTKMVMECDAVEIWESDQTKETEHGRWPLHIRADGNIPALSIIATFGGGTVVAEVPPEDSKVAFPIHVTSRTHVVFDGKVLQTQFVRVFCVFLFVFEPAIFVETVLGEAYMLSCSFLVSLLNMHNM